MVDSFEYFMQTGQDSFLFVCTFMWGEASIMALLITGLLD